MCTVTFIPTATEIYLTSNRDEHKHRGLALPPQQYNRNGHTMICPKDPDASGSWIALKDKKDAAVLLNGAFVKHSSKPPYRKSRGLIFLDIFEADDPKQCFRTTDLGGIEPFTLILFISNLLWEVRWDGTQKYMLQLNASQPYIWSSATLYDAPIAYQRQRWFQQWLGKTTEINTDKVLGFHLHAGNGDVCNNLVMNWDNHLYTVSITSILISCNRSLIRYRDLLSGIDVQKNLTWQLPDRKKETRFSKLYWWARRLMIRILRWEYWPAQLVYGPIYPYWCWLSLKARSFFFFSAANPGIRYAGFVQERKSDIYKLIPENYYPGTQLCYAGISIADIKQVFHNKAFHFPVIAKPDIGEQGVQVKLLQSWRDLETYITRSSIDFLIQEFVTYELEAGIFYYRMPGEEKGYISGIVGKEFLAVTGDGGSSIESLLKKSNRSLLQLPALRYTYGSFLDTVLPEMVSYTLVPYGNHSRGTKFIDWKHNITEELTTAIDNICRQIPGFYYGRLDIKFNSWEELAKGENFSIIELNGAGSLPTHIYDPAHSLFYAWKEICRHWRLLYQISKSNAQRKGLPLMNTTDGIKMIRDHYQYLKQITQV